MLSRLRLGKIVECNKARDVPADGPGLCEGACCRLGACIAARRGLCAGLSPRLSVLSRLRLGKLVECNKARDVPADGPGLCEGACCRLGTCIAARRGLCAGLSPRLSVLSRLRLGKLVECNKAKDVPAEGPGLCEGACCRLCACMAARSGLCAGLSPRLSVLSRLLGGGELSMAAAICQLGWLRSGSSRPSRSPTGPYASMSFTCKHQPERFRSYTTQYENSSHESGL